MIMKQYEMRGKRVVDIQPERQMSLEYYVITTKSEEDGSEIYGASIEKTEGEKIEKEEIKAISMQKDLVVELVDLMITHTVTPISMVYIVDDYITEKCCS